LPNTQCPHVKSPLQSCKKAALVRPSAIFNLRLLARSLLCWRTRENDSHVAISNRLGVESHESTLPIHSECEGRTVELLPHVVWLISHKTLSSVGFGPASVLFVIHHHALHATEQSTAQGCAAAAAGAATSAVSALSSECILQ